MNANIEFSGRIIEVDYERSTLLVRYEGAPPEVGSHLAPIAANGPEHTDWGRAALLWVLWHHQGGSSPVGQPIRFALGMGQHDHLSEHQVAEAKRWAELTSTRGVKTPVEPVAWMNRQTGKVTVCEPGRIYVFDVWIKSEIPLYDHPPIGGVSVADGQTFSHTDADAAQQEGEKK